MNEYRENKEVPGDDGRYDDLTLPDVIRVVVTDFVGFAANRLTRPVPPQMVFAVWIIGMDAVAGAIELEYFHSGKYLVDNWFHAWLRVIIGGFPAGVLRYWIVGSLFHLLVRAAGGSGPARTSRYLFLYAVLPVSIVGLAMRVAQMLAYGNAYFTYRQTSALDAVLSVVSMGAYAFSLVLLFRGMRYVHGCERRRSVAILVALTLGMLAMAAGLAAGRAVAGAL